MQKSSIIGARIILSWSQNWKTAYLNLKLKHLKKLNRYSLKKKNTSKKTLTYIVHVIRI